MKQIKATTPQNSIPRWAHLQRTLIDTMNDSLDMVLDRYLHPDGRFLWPYDEENFSNIDGLDDAYESFHSWPLFYLLGGDDKFLKLSHREYDVVTKQFSHYPTGHGHPMVVKEYEQGYDWMHQGEGYQFFYLLNLADPGNQKNRERAVRYAGFYLNEDPDIEPNYDSDLKMLKCCYLGSMGPAHGNFTGAPWMYGDWKKYYGLPFHDIEGVENVEDMKDEAKALKIGQAMKERLAYGDTAVNLFATSMVMNAYLHTGEEKYKQWICEYTDAWRSRAKANGGIIPDNVGPNGIVGECMDERWYGGYYGWTWPHGFLFIMEAATAAAQNQSLVEKSANMSLPQDLIERILEKAIERDGTLYAPQKFADKGVVHEYHTKGRFLTDPSIAKRTNRDDFEVLLSKDGWFEFEPLHLNYSAHILQMTHDSADMAVARKLRNNVTESYKSIKHFYAKNQGGHDDAWLTYLDGEYDGYPEEILEHNLFQVYDRLKMMREDTEDPTTFDNAYLQRRNPITCEGLTQLTMGGPLPLYNGGLLQVSVRYFDSAKKRPGLPGSVAALVRKIGDASIDLTLANTSPSTTRDLIIQAGTYGQDVFTEVDFSEPGVDVNSTVQVDSTHLSISLGPGAILELSAGVRRFENDPTYRLPWD
jgi:hypothetical protein